MAIWIESHTDLATHPKLFVLSRTLSVPIPYAVGTLHLLWYFTLKYSWRDGDLTRFDDVAIAQASGWDKEPKVLIEALQNAGFLDGKKVHDWLDFAGRLVKDRIRYLKANKVRTSSVRHPYAKRTSSVANLTLPNHTIPNQQKTLSPNGEKRPLTDLQKVVKGWKMLTDIPTEGEESASWDKVHFSRCSKSAKSLLDLFGYPEAVNAMEFVYDWLKSKKLDGTLETIVKHSDRYREVMGNGRRNSKDYAGMPIVGGAINKIASSGKFAGISDPKLEHPKSVGSSEN